MFIAFDEENDVRKYKRSAYEEEFSSHSISAHSSKVACISMVVLAFMNETMHQLYDVSAILHLFIREPLMIFRNPTEERMKYSQRYGSSLQQLLELTENARGGSLVK